MNYLIKDLVKREKGEIKPNQQLAYESGKTIFRKFQKRQYIHFFMDNISRDHVTDMELLRRYSKLLCFIDVYCRYDWVLPLKNNKGEAITKPNKIWIDKGSKF